MSVEFTEGKDSYHHCMLAIWSLYRTESAYCCTVPDTKKIGANLRKSFYVFQ